ncbi:Vacuolar protein sorting-associated protein 4A [Portunus trituberculatus]|uniref:Vacuolar protein sorting-associated protein 4A n=1 Tax=Portunus trituberculatus TaxID=210409 RepID=A0A5B7GYM0_PORTR|nr:Vacuolar protein sorting-associated protein 4A [Portunus trituberculatus]
MNPAALPGGVPDMGGAMSGPMNGGMGSPMEAGGGFLSNMPSFLPAMNTEMAGSLAGAFAGGIGALMDGFANGAGGAGGANISEYHDDDLLSDEEDEEDDEDDDEDDDDLDERGGMGSAVAVAAGAAAVGAVGGMMASRLMGSGAPHPAHMQHLDHPAGVPHPVHAQHPAHGSHPGPLGFTHPQYSTDMLSPPTAHPQLPPPSHHSNMAPSMSGGSVRSVDPLAGVPLGLAGVAAGASLLAPVVNGLLNNKPAAKLDNSDASSVTLPAATPKKEESEKKQESVEGVTDVTEAREETPKPTRVPSPKEDQEDDKASVGADSVPGSEEAVDGKSDTESVRKKTPSPVLVEKLGRLSPTGSESTPVLESASCASITDLASATESMRDSDTDNHSDAHNVTANLSDLDNDLHEAQPKVRAPPQYAVGGHLPIVIEKPTFGWQSMVGLDTAKDALKNLFMSETFPEVFEGTQGTCKGVLLFGPVGSGKTCLARALAKEAQDAILIGISTAYLATQPPSEAPKIVRYLFDHARMHSPAVILFDEVDALCYDRSSETAMKAKIELLHQIRALTTLNPAYPPGINPHAFNDGIMVLGTTNQPWLLEDDLRRIFTYNIHVKLPAEKAREELYRMFLQTLPHTLTDDHFKCLVAKSEGYNAADINMVVRQVVAQRSPTEPNKYIQNVSRPITYVSIASILTL